ncbi:MAG: hypothetical protein Q9196_000966 [Gyalolechia fulgens]
MAKRDTKLKHKKNKTGYTHSFKFKNLTEVKKYLAIDDEVVNRLTVDFLKRYNSLHLDLPHIRTDANKDQLADILTQRSEEYYSFWKDRDLPANGIGEALWEVIKRALSNRRRSPEVSSKKSTMGSSLELRPTKINVTRDGNQVWKVNNVQALVVGKPPDELYNVFMQKTKQKGYRTDFDGLWWISPAGGGDETEITDGADFFNEILGGNPEMTIDIRSPVQQNHSESPTKKPKLTGSVDEPISPTLGREDEGQSPSPVLGRSVSGPGTDSLYSDNVEKSYSALVAQGISEPVRNLDTAIQGSRDNLPTSTSPSKLKRPQAFHRPSNQACRSDPFTFSNMSINPQKPPWPTSPLFSRFDWTTEPLPGVQSAEELNTGNTVPEASEVQQYQPPTTSPVQKAMKVSYTHTESENPVPLQNRPAGVPSPENLYIGNTDQGASEAPNSFIQTPTGALQQHQPPTTSSNQEAMEVSVANGFSGSDKAQPVLSHPAGRHKEPLAPEDADPSKPPVAETVDLTATPDTSANPKHPALRSRKLPECLSLGAYVYTASPRVVETQEDREKESRQREELLSDNPGDDKEERLSSVRNSVTADHFTEETWTEFARVLQYKGPKDPTTKIPIWGLKTEPFVYQAYGNFYMLYMEAWQNGGYLADAMVDSAFRKVDQAREKGNIHEHLEPSDDQSSVSKCPSAGRIPQNIDCPCVKASPTNHIIPTQGPNLIMVIPAVLNTWLQQLEEHLDKAEWTVLIAHGSPVTTSFPRLSVEHADLVLPECKMERKARPPQNRVIIVTTPHSYKTRICKVFPPQHHPESNEGNGEYDTGIQWGRMVMDEAHKFVTVTTASPTIFRNNDTARKWMATGTPFDSNLKSMTTWIETIQDQPVSWTKPPKNTGWPAQDIHRSKLKSCTITSISSALKPGYEAYVRGGLQKNEAASSGILEKFQAFFSTMAISRSAYTTFNGIPLYPMQPSHHQDIYCDLGEKVGKLITDKFNSVYPETISEMTSEFGHKAKVYKEVPLPNLSRLLERFHRLRVLTSFPSLLNVDEPKGSDYTADELKEWLHIENDSICRLRTGSPVQKNIKTICKYKETPKIQCLDFLMTEIWETEKAVICTYAPWEAYILYWWLRKVKQKQVALIYGGMSKNDTAKIFASFQKPDGVQYIVGTTLLIGTGLNLQVARHLLLFDPEWQLKDELQAKYRIIRVLQLQVTMTWRMLCPHSKLDLAIEYRAKRVEALRGIVKKGYDQLAGIVGTQAADARLESEAEALNDTDLVSNNGAEEGE